MENKQEEHLFKAGDFVQNKIHGYTALIWGEYKSVVFSNYRYGSLILKSPTEYHFRAEIPSEIEKIIPTSSLIKKAKELLQIVNDKKEMDNLMYIELLSRVNEQEKELKNENKL